ncbi:MAG: SigF/SigG family RNA polymerase sporulation sigma factor [Clostridia bacterium]|nr:SigF/SigG family RNA polymerase sporulation sigma factor [Clostridia bacterium]
MQTKNFNENLFELLSCAKAGDTSARDKIVEENIGLVHSIVRRFMGRGYELEDLFQIGSIGLIKAIQKFDPSFEVKFSTYAVPMIMGEIKRFIRDDGIIKVSRSIKELAVKALSLRDAMLKESNTEPTIKELSEKLGASPEDVAMAIEAGLKPESIYAPIGDSESDSKTLADRIESKENCEGEVINRVLVQELLTKFDEREQKIIVLRYFKQKTQGEIAGILGISQVQVSRIEKRVLAEMRKSILEE